MPIYEYRCSSCGFQKEYIQKMTDAPLASCPECGRETFGKMISAAGFQLKGSGWYQTDFKGGAKKKEEAPAPACGAGGCPACKG
ncbi:MAG: zinc ribbon domain-containing protein [Betaproteobacteria bacterium]|nr:zinc ribbon domain-containing protein [Betaproteobacteria bacterium]